MTIPSAAFNDLPDWGLHLISARNPAFLDLLPHFQGAWGLPESVDSRHSAIFVNASGKAIVVLRYLWLYSDVDGNEWTSTQMNLGNSTQLDVLAGIGKITRDPWTFILPGSKRLITEQGMFGDNRDVLLPDELPPAAGPHVMGVSGRHPKTQREVQTAVLDLDFVILANGLCAGQDRSGLFSQLVSSLHQITDSASETIGLLRANATRGVIFDLMRPLTDGHPATRPILGSLFANGVIHALTHSSDEEILAKLESYANALPLPLHRPESA